MTTYTVAAPVSPTVRATGWTLLTILTLVIIGSMVFRVEIVARGEGRIIPVSRVQSIQSAYKGKITNIQVGEGDFVKAGTPLIMLDSADAESNVRRVRVNLDNALQEQAVASAILAPLSVGDTVSLEDVTEPVSFVAGLTDASQQSAEALAVATLNSIRDEARQLDSDWRKLVLSRKVAEARLANAKADSNIVSDKFRSVASLEKQGVISRSDYLDRLRQTTAAQGEVTVAERTIEELAAAEESNRRERQMLVSSNLMKYRKQLNDSTNAIASLQAELNAAENVLRNMTLTAPIDGVVENLTTFTVGGFLDEGTVVMRLVPESSPLEIEAFFDNRDIGFLSRGQKAYVKFDAFPSERFGIVNANVSAVGADAREDPVARKWIYAARLRLERAYIVVSHEKLKFTSGMTAKVDVITGDRRIISYFFDPIVRVLQDAFGER